MIATAAPPTAFRRLVLAAGVVALLAAAGFVVKGLFVDSLNAPLDFTAFWVAGHLAAHGENPYDPGRVHELQHALGLDDTAIVVWNPPWALTLVMPMGLLPFRVAYGMWVLVNLALVMASAELLWRGFGGNPGWRWVAYLLTLTFTPTLFLIGSGQITTVVLFGLAGYLAAMRAERPWAAGAFAALTAVKPHLLALFALWLLWEAYRNAAGRKVVLAGVVVGVCACVPPTLANPHVWNDYIRAVTAPSSAEHHHLSDWAPPLAGWWLRQAVPGQPFWVQWVPLFLAVAGSVCCWRTIQSHRKSQADALPWLVGCSLLVAPYGVWQHDLVLLLVPVLAVAARLAERFDTAAVRVGLTWLASVNAVSLAMMLEQAGSRWYVWFTPCVLLGCAVVSRLAVRQPAIARVEAGATA